jgi:hypothetical protein
MENQISEALEENYGIEDKDHNEVSSIQENLVERSNNNPE